jgi:hypothetical protein
MELLLLSSINSLTIYSDVYSTVGLHATLVQSYVDAAAYAETFE